MARSDPEYIGSFVHLVTRAGPHMGSCDARITAANASGTEVRLDVPHTEFPIGATAEVTFSLSDGLYKISGRITAVVAKGEPKPSIVIEAPGGIVRIQRRAFVRAPLKFRIGWIGGGAVLEGTTIDVSAGGAHILLKDPKAVAPEVGERGRVKLYVDPNDPDDVIACRASVVRVEKAVPARVAVEFLDIKEVQRKRIMQLVFAEQAARRLRSLGE